MKIAVDCRGLNVSFIRGMGKYLGALLQAIDKLMPCEWELLSDRPDLPFKRPQVERGILRLFEMKGCRFRTWEQLGLPWQARRRSADLLFCPNTALPWWQPLPAIVTVHDTVPWQTDQQPCEQAWYWQRLLPRALRKATAIVVPSESSRTDVERLWPHLSHKLHTIRHGLHERWLAQQLDGPPDSVLNFGVRQPYFVYIGGDERRKRLDWALKVFTQLRDCSAQLLVVGATENAHAFVHQSVPDEIARRVVILPYTREEDMPRLIQGAVAVLYPTLYEGFGFPAVEAQAVGTPVLFSPFGSLKELQGPGAAVLPAHDIKAWLSTCERLLRHRRESPRLLTEARAWATQFSWEESARKHLELFVQAGRAGGRLRERFTRQNSGNRQAGPAEPRPQDHKGAAVPLGVERDAMVGRES